MAKHSSAMVGYGDAISVAISGAVGTVVPLKGSIMVDVVCAVALSRVIQNVSIDWEKQST